MMDGDDSLSVVHDAILSENADFGVNVPRHLDSHELPSQTRILMVELG